MSISQKEVQRRRTFAIISHPDAGKTTLTEKLLLYAGAIQLAGTVKSRKASRHATSDWMELEKQRGISVTTSVMQFNYRNHIVNLLDTPGHEDFSEDTYRTLTAVDAALMVIDAAKGVEPRTIKLMEVCRLRNTPITTFINKMDRETRDPFELIDEIEAILKIKCIPITWPIGSGKAFRGIYDLEKDLIYCHQSGMNERVSKAKIIVGLESLEASQLLDDDEKLFKETIELLKAGYGTFNHKTYLKGELTPVFFGSAINNFGVEQMLNAFIEHAPPPQLRFTVDREVTPEDPKFSGFVFKIQANMDPAHRDRVAFLRIASGQYSKGIKIYQVRTQKTMQLNNALTFMAGERESTEEAWPGDIIGIHNHGTIQIGDTFTQGENLKFIGIPNFAPELFRLVELKDPLRQKALLKGLIQLSEEGATQVFRPLKNNDLILGAVGVLQFDVVAYRLLNEYQVHCTYRNIDVVTARWIQCDDKKILEQFIQQQHHRLAYDHAGQLTYMAPSMVNLDITMEEWSNKIQFLTTREV